MRARGDRAALLVAAVAIVAATLGAQARPLAGLVVDELGEPVTAAVVEVRWLAFPELPGSIGHSLGDVARAELRTDARGRFRFEPPHQGPYLLIARARDRESEQAFPVVPGDFVQLALDAPFAVAGVVVAGGAPVAGVEVREVSADHSAAWRRGVYRYPEVSGRARTDARGRFAIPFERGYLRHPIWYPLRSLFAVADDGRHSALSEIVRPIDASRDLRLELVSGGARLRVLDPDGAPVVGARVADARMHEVELRTDRDGRVTAPFPGSVLSVHADGFALHELVLDPDLERPNTVRLRRAGRLMVGVVRVGGVPLAGARVLVSIPAVSGPPLELTTVTSGGGSFEVRGLPDGVAAFLFVEVEGRFRPLLRVQGPSAAYAAVDVPAVRPVAGQMLDPDGVPVAHARVALLVEGWPPWVTWADHAGRFQFELALPAHGALELIGQADGRGIASAPVRRDAAEPVELRAVRGRTIEGTVVDENGVAVPGAFVTAVFSSGLCARMPGPGERLGAQVVFSDERGRFRFAGLPDDSDPSVLAMLIRKGVRLQGSASVVAEPVADDPVSLEVIVRPIDG